MNTTHPVAKLVQDFFTKHLAAEKGLSPNSILSYRDAMKQFLCYTADQLGKSVDKLTVEDFDDQMILAFLDSLETERGNSINTRNSRLAAIHTFFRYVARQEPSALERCQRIGLVPTKRAPHKTVECLDEGEMRALLESVDRQSERGSRDYAMLLFLHNTGARAQELAALQLDELRLDTPSQVTLLGKGQKQRTVPLSAETVAALRQWLDSRRPADPQNRSVFLNHRGQSITRFGIRDIVRRYARKAQVNCPSLESKNVTTHTLRHTAATHMLDAGNDLNTVRVNLGHASLETAHIYAHTSMKKKREALDACSPIAGELEGGLECHWHQPGIVEWLETL